MKSNKFKTFTIIFGAILAGDGVEALINSFPINLWFGRIGGLIFTGIAGYILYNSFFTEEEKNDE